MQIGFYFDQSRCTGCYACEIACRDWHDIQDTTVKWRRVSATEQGAYPDVQLSYMSLSCLHCAHPACRDACPSDAIHKRESDGTMMVDADTCLGADVCGVCREACPYGAPQFSSGPDAKMQLCTMCHDRLGKGEQPICAAACPMRALDCGDMEELREKYGHGNEARGFSYSAQTRPSIIIKPRYE
jgi:anaerobic dimethyl sulfoxide reductase subunit B (iron-sulfur subunit)